MSDPDRVNLAFIWDTDSPNFSRRTFMRTMAFVSAAGFAAASEISKLGDLAAVLDRVDQVHGAAAGLGVPNERAAGGGDGGLGLL